MQLVDTTTGAHLWADNYERTFNSDALFASAGRSRPAHRLDGCRPSRRASAQHEHGGSQPPADQLSPYEAVLRSFAYFERVTAEELAAARIGLEAAVQKAPDYADAWALLALLCVQEYGHGFNVGRGFARRGSRGAPRCGGRALESSGFFQRWPRRSTSESDLEAFRHRAERAAALNPMDGNSLALLGELLVYAGDTERGLTLSARARQLNPHHPGWYRYADFFNAYWSSATIAARSSRALKFNMPSLWGAHSATAAVCGQLGERDAARRALTLLRLRPDFAGTVRAPHSRAMVASGAPSTSSMDCAKRASLYPARPFRLSPCDRRLRFDVRIQARRVRTKDSGWPCCPSIRGANPDVAALADGLSEAIVSGLSLFSYLRVIARSSTLRYAREPPTADVSASRLAPAM